MYTMETMRQEIAAAVEKVRALKPLAPSITNTVTVNFVANAQLAAGGTAAMIYLPDEAEALAEAGASFYINVGTLLPIYRETVPLAAQKLHALHKPWVLDPVAIGIGSLRTELLSLLKNYPPAVIRGNASEIIALAGLWNLSGGTETSNVHGVDSTDTVQAARLAAISLARFTGGAVAVSGTVDLITDGRQAVCSYGGSSLMESITGCGCSLGGVIAVYSAVASPFIAALCGTAAYNFAGREAERHAAGTGSFQLAFLDALYNASPKDISSTQFTLEEV